VGVELDRQALFAEYEGAIVSACDPFAMDDFGWSDPALFCAMRGSGCVVITAWNPGFQRPGQQVNEASNARLLAQLQDLAYEVWPADGASPDGQFHEPGFLVWDMPVEVACALAADFGQFAIYAYTEEGERRVVACS